MRYSWQVTEEHDSALLWAAISIARVEVVEEPTAKELGMKMAGLLFFCASGMDVSCDGVTDVLEGDALVVGDAVGLAG